MQHKHVNQPFHQKFRTPFGNKSPKTFFTPLHKRPSMGTLCQEDIYRQYARIANAVFHHTYLEVESQDYFPSMTNLSSTVQ